MVGIIIGGVSRAGKTTLTERIHQETGFSMISGDLLVSAFGDAFPDLGLRHGDHEKAVEKFWEFSAYLMKMHSDWEERPFIFDSTYFDPDKIVEWKMHEKYIVVFLGYPTLTAEQKLLLVRKHDPSDDWTTERDDEKLSHELGQFIALSRDLQAKCAKHGIPFYDTGADFKGAHEKAYQFILERL